MIKVLFFGKLREALACAELSYESSHIQSLLELKQDIYTEHPEWQQLLEDESTQVAVNQSLVSGNVPIPEDAEVAFFPPVTGG